MNIKLYLVGMRTTSGTAHQWITTSSYENDDEVLNLKEFDFEFEGMPQDELEAMLLKTEQVEIKKLKARLEELGAA